jgi:hypothetical protein
MYRPNEKLRDRIAWVKELWLGAAYVFVCRLGRKTSDLDDVQPLLDAPEDLDVSAIVPYGYPAQPTGKGRKNRKPIS